MVVISPYRDDWPAAFEVVARRLAAILGERALRIDHVGSTAVPGLDAKNVIDVQVTVRALTDADPLEAEVKATMIAHAEEAFLLIDDSKLQTRGLNAVGRVADLAGVFTHGVHGRALAALRAGGVEVRAIDGPGA